MQVNPSQVSETPNFSQSIEQDTTSSLPPSLDNSDSPKAKSSKKIIILTFVVAFLILIIPGSITYYVLNRESEKIEDQVEFRSQEQQDITFDEDVIEIIEMEEDFQDEYLIYDTSIYYPKLSVKYPSGWTVSEELIERDLEGQKVKDVDISFEKGDHSLRLTFWYEYPAFGLQGDCYRLGEIDYVHIGNGLIRGLDENQYYYGDLVDKNFNAAEYRNMLFGYGLDENEYVACGYPYLINMKTAGEASTYDDKNSGNIDLSVRGEVFDENIVLEADDIVRDIWFKE